MKKEIIKDILLVLCTAIVVGIVSYIVQNTIFKREQQPIILTDTVYNHITLDSIHYNIIKKDSIIINIKSQMQYEIYQSTICSDTDAVKLFYELLSE